MSLVINNDFGEYYNSLVSKQRTTDDFLKDVRRDELADRKRITEEEVLAFGDMLHIAGVWISQKKDMENGRGPKMDRFALALYNKEREIWFPTAPPKAVEPKTRNLTTGFPKTAYRDMCEEEAELRRWLHGVEGKLREHIERACQESYYILTCFQELYAHEARGRARLEKDEAEIMAGYRKKMFLVAPPDFYRRLAIERHGATDRPPTPPPRELTFEEEESYERERLQSQELAARSLVHQPLVDALEAQLFIVNHQEICGRQEVEQQEREQISLALTQQSRDSFGLLYYQTIAVALHVTPHITPLLSQMCSAQLTGMKERGDQFMEHLAEVKREQTEKGTVAWELQFPEVAAQMFANQRAARRSTSSVSAPPAPPSQAVNHEAKPKAQEQPRPVPAPAPAKTSPTTSSPMPKPNEESGNAVSVVSVLPVEAAPVNSLLKKNSGDDANGSAGSLKTSHTVRFAEEVDVVTIDPVQPKTEAQGFQSHSGGRSMDWDDMGEAPCTSNDQDDEDEEAIQRAAKRAAKKKAGKKGSFHAFRSDSDEDDDADGYAY